MSITFFEQYKVYIEKNDGTVLTMPVSVQSISVNSGFDGRFESEIILRGVGNPVWSMGSNVLSENTSMTDEEWKCTWCGRPNRREDEVCKSCGGARSFLYGAMGQL